MTGRLKLKTRPYLIYLLLSWLALSVASILEFSETGQQSATAQVQAPDIEDGTGAE
jgi:hypothetical protein